MSVGVWEAKFLKIWNYEHEQEYHDWGESGNSRWHYFLGYAIDGNTAMYEATCNTKYLDRALHYVNDVVESAEVSSSLPNSQYKDSYLAWQAVDEPDVNGEEEPLYESYMWRYVTKLLRVIRQNPHLYNDPAYRSQYDSLLDFAEINIFEKWYSRDPSNIYRSRTHMASHWAYIALDLLLLSDDATRKAWYQEVLTADQYRPVAPLSVLAAGPDFAEPQGRLGIFLECGVGLDIHAGPGYQPRQWRCCVHDRSS